MRLRALLPWLALVVVLGGALVVGARPEGGVTAEERAARIAAEVRCPTCQGLSAAESTAPAAEAVRTFIGERIAAGDSDAEIKAELASRYGRDILLRPSSEGIAGIVWVLPVVLFGAGAAGLVLAFARWRSRAPRSATDADRRLVEEALRT